MERLPSYEDGRSLKSLSESARPKKSTRPRLECHFLTLFPEVFQGIFNSSLLFKAQKKGLISFQVTQIRDFATDKHRKVDDTPYGGGEGMLLKPDVLYRAWQSIIPRKASLQAKRKTATVLLSPQGQVFNQKMAHELASYSKLVFVCGHYEGVDERFIDHCVDREISIGNYILTGGELAAAVIADTISRLIPGVIGNERSLTQESLEQGLLKYPQFTRPATFQGRDVPSVLLEGNHQAIQTWRDEQRRERTQRKRPDLWESILKDE
jgi:tRNA (guanine37-N1)-methyltransferase